MTSNIEIIPEELLSEITGGDGSVTCKQNQNLTGHRNQDGTVTYSCDAA